jgi:hypothetical protein
MKLENGITGFYERTNEQPFKEEGKHFKQICFSLINSNRGSVIKFEEPNGTNLFNVEVLISDKNTHILLNAHYPYIAFASDVQFENIAFIDDVELSNFFKPYYNILNTHQLNKTMASVEMDLNSAELKQIDYWKPTRIGDIIFNYWD